MVSMDWRVERPSGNERGDAVTLVALSLENPSRTPRRVRVDNRLDGPVWPPRREGVPEAGWDDGSFEGVVDAEGTLSLGYASPAEPTEPPAAVVRTRPATDESDSPSVGRGDLDPGESHVDVESTAAGVVRALGDPQPPADAVPLPTAEATEAESEPAFESEADPSDAEALPDPVAAWLSRIEGRIERGDPLADAETLTEAARAVDRADGLSGVEEVVQSLRGDRAALRTLSRRADDLLDRTEGTIERIPADAFGRLA